jgi:hypothetical protein
MKSEIRVFSFFGGLGFETAEACNGSTKDLGLAI